MSSNQQNEARYKAFISYAWEDKATAHKLQSWLETFRLPKSIASKYQTERKIGRVFRDETDISAQPDLWSTLKREISASENLIVICSPSAASSVWVTREIEHFLKTTPDGKVFAIIIDGEPNSENTESECFPAPFREHANRSREPIAADVTSDGRDRAFIRLASGMMGLPFDAIWRRERRRQIRQRTLGVALTSIGLLLTLTAAVGGWFAINGILEVEESKSELIALEARTVAVDESRNSKHALLLALLADPAASSNIFERIDANRNGYPVASAILKRVMLASRFSWVLDAPTDRVTAVAFSDDGRRMATGHHGGTISIWDSSSRQHMQLLTGHNLYVTGLAFLPEDNAIVSASVAGDLILWDLEQGAMKAKTDKDLIPGGLSFALSSDKKFLALGNFNGGITIVEVSDGFGSTRFFKNHAGGMTTAIAFSPDNKRVAAGSSLGEISVWNLDSGEREAVSQNEQPWIKAMVFLQNGMDLIVAQDDALQLWFYNETDTHWSRFGSIESLGGEVLSIDASKDGSLIAAGLANNSVELISTRSEARIGTLRGHSEQVSALSFSPDSDFLASGGDDGVMVLWRLTPNTMSNTVGNHSMYVSSVSYSKDGSILVSSSSLDGTQVRDTRSNELMHSRGIEHGYTVASLVTPNGKHYITAHLTGGIGDTSIGSSETTIRTWETATARAVSTMQPISGGVQQLAISQDNRTLAVASFSRSIQLWDVVDGQLIKTLEGLANPGISVAFSPVDDVVASGTTSGQIVLWDWKSGRVIRQLDGHVNAVPALAFSDDGNVLASGGDDDIIVLWDIANGRKLAQLMGHVSDVSSLEFSSDGRVLFSAAEDSSIKVWDTLAGELLLSFPDNLDRRRSFFAHEIPIAVTPNGSTIASGWEDGSIVLWDVPALIYSNSSSAVMFACNRLEEVGSSTSLSRDEQAEFSIVARLGVDATGDTIASICSN